MKRTLIKKFISSESYKILSDDRTYFYKKIRLEYLKYMGRFDQMKMKNDLISLNCKNLVKIVEVKYEKNYVDILTEWIDGFPLDIFMGLKKYGKYLDNTLIDPICAGMITGISYLHEKGMLHGDLKASNIILEKRNLMPKITDFCFNYIRFHKKVPFYCKLFSVKYKYALFSSQAYLPPKAFQNHAPDRYIDHYALGLILFMLFTGKPPVPLNIISDKERMIKWKFSDNCLDYYIKNLENTQISDDKTNFILGLIIDCDGKKDLLAGLSLFT